MNSLKEVYNNLAHQDHEKVAQYNADHGIQDYSDIDADLLKQAQDYDSIGRIMAHNAFGDMLKQAAEDALPGVSEEDKAKAIAALLAAANNEPSAVTDEDEDEEGTAPSVAEKKASIRDAVLERMAQDPAYVAQLVGKYYGR